MRQASAPVLFLIGLLVVAAVAGATYGVATVVGVGDEEVSTPGTGAPPDSSGSTPTTEGPPLGAEQVEVTGLALNVAVEGIAFDPIALPLTISTPERGLGSGARFEDVVVDGEPATLTWDAGRPLVLNPAGGALAVGLVNLYLGPNTATVGFPNRGVHGFVPGSYRVDTPVALSRGGGLGQPRDAVGFDATDESTVSFTGGASTPVAVEERELTGPGRVVLTGAFTVRRPDGTSEVTGVELPAGAFELTATPLASGAGWEVTALLQGEVLVS